MGRLRGGAMFLPKRGVSEARVEELIAEGGGGGGVDPWPNILTSPMVALGNSIVANAADAAYLVRIERRSAAITVSAISVGIVTQAGNLDVGIYTSDGTTWTRVASSGSVAVGAPGKQDVDLTAPYEIAANTDYWLAVAFSDATAEIDGNDVPLVAPEHFSLTKASAFPLPATITDPDPFESIPIMVG